VPNSTSFYSEFPCGARTTINESTSCHFDGAKRLKNLKQDASGKPLG